MYRLNLFAKFCYIHKCLEHAADQDHNLNNIYQWTRRFTKNFSNRSNGWMVVPSFLWEPLCTMCCEWFNSAKTFIDMSQAVYPKPEGLMDSFYLAHLFQTIERNIIRKALPTWIQKDSWRSNRADCW